MNIIDFDKEIPELIPSLLLSYLERSGIRNVRFAELITLSRIQWIMSIEEITIFRQGIYSPAGYYWAINERSETLLPKLKRLGNLKAFI